MPHTSMQASMGQGYGLGHHHLERSFGLRTRSRSDRHSTLCQIHPYAEKPEELDFPSDFLERGRFPVYRENFRLLKEKVGDRLVIFGHSEGAFTCAAFLVGTEEFMKWCLKKPGQVERTLEVTKEAAIAAANFAFDNGADYFVFGEPTAGPALLSPRFSKNSYCRSKRDHEESQGSGCASHLWKYRPHYGNVVRNWSCRYQYRGKSRSEKGSRNCPQEGCKGIR